MMPTVAEVRLEDAGPRLDSWVWEHVFAGKPMACRCGPAPNGYDGYTGACRRCGLAVCPRYSADINAAWCVVREFGTRRFSQRHLFSKVMTSLPLVTVRTGRSFPTEEQELAVSWPWAMLTFPDRVPEVVCKAALIAVIGTE